MPIVGPRQERLRLVGYPDSGPGRLADLKRPLLVSGMIKGHDLVVVGGGENTIRAGADGDAIYRSIDRLLEDLCASMIEGIQVPVVRADRDQAGIGRNGDGPRLTLGLEGLQQPPVVVP